MQVSHIISCRAPVVATWADRFSWCCWWWFSQFFTCPITLPQCLSVIVYHLCSTPSLLPWARWRGRRDTESTRAVLSHSTAVSWLSLRWSANWIQTTAEWHRYEHYWSHTGCAAWSPTRLGLAADSHEIGWSIGTLMSYHIISFIAVVIVTHTTTDRLIFYWPQKLTSFSITPKPTPSHVVFAKCQHCLLSSHLC